MTAGTQLNVGRFSAELDYYLGTRNMDYSEVVSDTLLGTRYVKDQSVALNLKYDFGKWRPSVKGTWNQRYDKKFDNTAYQTSGIQAAMGYYPFGGLAKDLRFHAMYTYNTTHFKGGYASLDNVDKHTILVGTRWLFKVK